MNTVMRYFLAAACLFSVAACNNRHEGPVERAGEKIDDAVDNVKDGQSPFHKRGVAERAGEAIDDAASGNRR